MWTNEHGPVSTQVLDHEKVSPGVVFFDEVARIKSGEPSSRILFPFMRATLLEICNYVIYTLVSPLLRNGERTAWHC